MLGVFVLVVMTSVLDGVMDKVTTGFSGMSWDGTAVVVPKAAETSEEQKRFAMSPGLRYEDLARVTLRVARRSLAFLPRATRRSSVRTTGGQRAHVRVGVTPPTALLMNRPIASGRGLTEDDEKRRSTVADRRLHARLEALRRCGPVGRDIVVEGIPFRIVGLQEKLQIFSEEIWYDANGIQIPLSTYMDRMDPNHKLTQISVKLAGRRRPDGGLLHDPRAA